MNWDQIEGKWKELKSKVQEKWGKLTDDDLNGIARKHEELTGLLQQRYGYDQDQAEEELREFARPLRP